MEGTSHSVFQGRVGVECYSEIHNHLYSVCPLVCLARSPRPNPTKMKKKERPMNSGALFSTSSSYHEALAASHADCRSEEISATRTYIPLQQLSIIRCISGSSISKVGNSCLRNLSRTMVFVSEA